MIDETTPNKDYEASQSERQDKYDQTMNASPDVITAAIKVEVDNLTGLLRSNKVLSTNQRSGLLQRVRHLGAVEEYARNWQMMPTHARDSSVTFSAFMDKKIDDAIEIGEDSDTMDKLVRVQSWVGSDEHQRLVGDMLQVDRESASEQKHRGSPVDPEQTRAPDTYSSAHQEATTADARRSVESLYESAELYDEIIKFSKNKTAIHVEAKGGFQSVGDIDKRQTKNLEVIPHDVQKEQEKLGFSEAVSFTKLQEFDQHEVPAQVGWEKRGVFRKEVPKMGTKLEDIPNSEHPLKIVNPATGKPEPAVRFRYKFQYDSHAMQLRYEGKLPRYQGFNDPRDGQNVLLGIDLPESIADRLQGQISTDPGSVRQLVEQLVLSNNNGNVTEEYWNRGIGNGRIKPPYEDLPKDWKIAIVTGREAMQYGVATVLEYEHSRLTVAK